MSKPACRVVVYDTANKPIRKATVSLSAEGSRKQRITLRYSSKTDSFEADVPASGIYEISVSATGLAPQSRRVDVDATGFRELFILGKKDQPAFYRGRVRVPFEPRPELLAVALEDESGKDQAADKRFTELCKKHKLQAVSVPAAVTRQRVRVVQLPSKLSAVKRAELHKQLAAARGVLQVGPIVRLDDKSVSFLTSQVIVRFKPRKSQKEMKELAAKHGLKLVREFQQAPRTYLATIDGPPTYALLDTCEAALATGELEYIEPDLMSTAVDDAINPSDNLFAQQWHHAIVHTPDAWQLLSDALGGNRAFGRPTVIVGVMDSGVDPTHPDFAGTVSDGQPKTFASYDFVNMVANNDSLAGNHGTSCAGIAVASAGNTSAVPGQWEGVAGAAGNCRVMGLRRSGPESRYADAYMWAAGFNVTTAGFPAQLAQGADIISNSFGYSVGLPISALMASTFDYLTDHGRGGKGTLLFFSIGNYLPNVDFTLERPWAAYDKTLAIGASSIGNDGVSEIIADYSNFSSVFGTGGGVIDVCAPSHDAYVGGAPLHDPPANYATITTDIVGQGNLAGPSGNMDYQDGFGGTSSSTPLTAGIAALVLSAQPGLTWTAVRDILRRTAVKINFTNTDPIAQYVDTDGDGENDYSRYYGFGRVDAAAAVAAALTAKLRVFDVHPKRYIPEKLWIREGFKDRYAEVKMGSYDKDWIENPGWEFEEVINPEWRVQLEQRLASLEARVQGKAFIRQAERPAVGEQIARGRGKRST